MFSCESHGWIEPARKVRFSILVEEAFDVQPMSQSSVRTATSPSYRPAAEALRAKNLEREVKELRRANEILKLIKAFLAQLEPDRPLKP